MASFLWGDRNFRLRDPVECFSSVQSDLFVQECPQYRIIAHGSTRSAAQTQLAEGFAILFDGLGDEPDEAFTADAVELRDRLLADLATGAVCEVR